jgi:hypothetical protein
MWHLKEQLQEEEEVVDWGDLHLLCIDTNNNNNNNNKVMDLNKE